MKPIKILSHDAMLDHFATHNRSRGRRPMTPEERTVLSNIRSFYKQYKYSPTYAELSDLCGFNVYTTIVRLLRANRITKVYGKHRCFRVIN